MTLQMYIGTVTNVMSVLMKMMSWERDGESLMMLVHLRTMDAEI